MSAEKNFNFSIQWLKNKICVIQQYNYPSLQTGMFCSTVAKLTHSGAGGGGGGGSFIMSLKKVDETGDKT